MKSSKQEASTQCGDTFKADASTQCENSFKADASTQCEGATPQITVQPIVEMKSEAIQIDRPDIIHKVVQTDELEEENEVTPFRIEQIKDSDKLVNFYTGFSSFLHLLACFEFLGTAVAVLSYDPSKCIENPSKACTLGRHHILTPLNDFS